MTEPNARSGPVKRKRELMSARLVEFEVRSPERKTGPVDSAQAREPDRIQPDRAVEAERQAFGASAAVDAIGIVAATRRVDAEPGAGSV